MVDPSIEELTTAPTTDTAAILEELALLRPAKPTLLKEEARQTCATGAATDEEHAIARLRRITVSKVFWNLVQEALPGLAKHPGYVKLFWYLLFGTWHDTESRNLLLCCKLLSRMEGRDPANPRAGQFLKTFKKEVLPPAADFHWSQWRKGKCRQLLSFHIPQLVEALQREQECAWHAQGRVLLDGSAYTEPKARQKRREHKEKAEEREPFCPEARMIRDYLHHLPPNQFSKTVAKNYLDAVNTARTLIGETEKKTKSIRKEQLRILGNIHCQPQPFYTASEEGNTVRLISVDGIPNVKREVRWALTSNWSEADLRNSQLAICAWIWKVRDVEDFLRTGQSFWSYLFDYIGVPQKEQARVKEILKESVYATCYGMKEGHIKGTTAKNLTIAGLPKEYAYAFLEAPLVRAMLDAREEGLARIAEEGGAKTCFGKSCPLSEERQAHQIMAEVAQAWEMKLIAPAFELAKQRKDEFRITLYQYDGFSVAFSRRPEQFKKEIEAVVNKGIDALGIATELEWK